MDYMTENAINNADNALDKELAEKLVEERLAAKRAAMVSLGDEPTDTTYVAFEKKFDEKGVVYKFVAVKADDRWYTTSTVNRNACVFNNWHDLVIWLVKGPFPTDSITKLYPASK